MREFIIRQALCLTEAIAAFGIFLLFLGLLIGVFG